MKPIRLKQIRLLSIKYPQKTGYALLVLLLCLSVTMMVTINTKKEADADAYKDFKFVCSDLKTKISERLHTQSHLLRSGSVFFESSDSVTRQEWKEFYENSKIETELPEMKGLGYIQIIPTEQVKNHEAKTKNSGIVNYRIWPKSNYRYSTTIIYFEPNTYKNKKVLGYDMLTNAHTRTAMERAGENDLATLTGNLYLPFSPKEKEQIYATMFIPVYKKKGQGSDTEQKGGIIKGWVFAPYKMSDLMHGVLGRWDNKTPERIRLQIFEGLSANPKTLLYDSQQKTEQANRKELARSFTSLLDFNGEKWTLLFTQAGEKSTFLEGKTTIVFASNILISLLLFFLSLLLFSTKQRAHEIAKHLTAELQASEERWKFAIEGTNDGLWDWNLTNNEFFLSPKWKAMLGFKDYELANKQEEWEKRIHPEDLRRCLAEIEQHLNGENPSYSSVHRMLCKDGSIKWILDRGKVIRYDLEKKPMRMIGTQTDMTERIEMEKQLRQLNIDKDRFLSILAHDLKNPFNSILGFLGLLKRNMERYSKEEIDKHITTVLESAQHTYDLLDDLLNWSHLQSDTLPFEPEKLKLQDIFTEIVEILKLNSKNKNISISFKPHAELYIYADKQMISATMRNLLSNAIKFTNKGGQIEVKTQEDHSHIIITVSDNGIGIDKETIDKLFDISQKHSSKGTENEKGTGFGLFLCKDFVEKHGGRIWVESETGKGSHFSFTIPKLSKPLETLFNES